MMDIHVTFRHADSSEVLKEHVKDKIERFTKYLIKPVSLHVTLTVEKNRHVAEILLSESHNTFTAKETSHDMYRSVDGALERILHQLKKHKEKVKNHHKRILKKTAP